MNDLATTLHPYDAHTLALSQAKCQKKLHYNTMLLALNAGWCFSWKYKTRYAIYQCTWCKQWHLSSQVGRTTAMVCTL